jgi:exosome complex component RRP45
MPLAIHHTPLCLTFAYFASAPPILDPTHLEATLCSGTLTLTMNAQREMCVLSKAGGTPLDLSEIMAVVRVGVDRVRELVKILEDALELDRGGRVIEVR